MDMTMSLAVAPFQELRCCGFSYGTILFKVIPSKQNDKSKNIRHSKRTCNRIQSNVAIAFFIYSCR